MQYTYRNVRCSKAGFTQEQALESLYDHPNFDPATMQVMAIRQAGTHWVAKLKVAEFPPSDEGSDEAESMDDVKPPKKEGPPSEEGGDDEGAPAEGGDEGGDEGGPDGPPKPPGAPGEEKGGGELHHLMTLVQQIADKLGIGGEPGMPGAEDPMLGGPEGPAGPLDGPPAPPHGGPHGAPHGGPAGPPAKPPLRPGMTPPGVTPTNTPAFASTQKSQSIVGRVASFTATEATDMSFKQAKAELEALYGPQGYKVKQLREGSNDEGQRVIHALLSVRD